MAGPAKQPPAFLTVARAVQLTPNMIRVTLTGDRLHNIPADCAGANFKLFLASEGQTRDDFAAQLTDGPRPAVRTYTVRHARPDTAEIDVDFVDHGDAGPASAWARAAVRDGAGFCGFAGPGTVKVTSFHADWYLLAADMSAIPVVAATLEAMPRDARGLALIEITGSDDWQDIDAPEGVELRWLLHPTPSVPSDAVPDMVAALDWPEGVVQTCVAGESGTIKTLRQFLHSDKGLPREDTYISGYWKIGLVEDEHQQMKRLESAA